MPYFILWFLSLFGGWEVVMQGTATARRDGDRLQGAVILEENKWTKKRRAYFEPLFEGRWPMSVAYVEFEMRKHIAKRG